MNDTKFTSLVGYGYTVVDSLRHDMTEAQWKAWLYIWSSSTVRFSHLSDTTLPSDRGDAFWAELEKLELYIVELGTNSQYRLLTKAAKRNFKTTVDTRRWHGQL